MLWSADALARLRGIPRSQGRFEACPYDWASFVLRGGCCEIGLMGCVPLASRPHSHALRSLLSFVLGSLASPFASKGDGFSSHHLGYPALALLCGGGV